MSLINEALKRAEAEKRRHEGAGAPASQPARNRTRPRAAVALGVVVIATVCALTYLSMPPETKPRPSGRPQEARGAALGEAAAPGPSIPAVKEPAATRPAPVSPASPPRPVAAKAALAGATSKPAAAKAALADATSRPAAAKAPLAAATSRPAGETPAASPKPVFDASQFRLGAILKSATGAHALINNHTVTVGDEVNGARVVAIEQYHVVLEKAGQRIVLRM